jgi:hypothetical protein
MAENWGLTKPANHDILYLACGGVVGSNFFVCLLTTTHQLTNKYVVPRGPALGTKELRCYVSAGMQQRQTGCQRGSSAFMPNNERAAPVCYHQSGPGHNSNGGTIMVKSQNSTTPQDSPNSHEHISSKVPAHADPITEIARLWPKLGTRSRQCVVALALGLLILDTPEEARAWRGEVA